MRDAAACCGLTPWQRFLRIEVPLAWPSILTAAILAFAHTLGEFGVVLMVGGNLPGETRTLSVAIYDRMQAFDDRSAGIMAATLLGDRRRDADGDDNAVAARGSRAVAERRLSVTLRQAAPFRSTWSSPATRATCWRSSVRRAAARRRSSAALPASTAGAGVSTVRRETWTDTATAAFAPPHQRAVGFVFQEYALFPHLTALGNVVTALGHRRARRTAAAGASSCWRWCICGHVDRASADSPAASASASRWHARSRASRRCCCSTSRSPPSIAPCAGACRTRSTRCAARSTSL